MIAIPVHAPDDEIALLDRVGQYADYPSLKDFSEQALQEITAERGLDFATALLFDRILRSSTHGEFIRKIERIRGSDYGQQEHVDRAVSDNQSATNYESLRGDKAVTHDLTVAVAPGAFYRQYPHTGAGGEVVLREAARIGFRSELIPTESVGTPEENGRLIRRWLADRNGGPIILASLSKGGTDVKMAMSHPGADECFGNVVGWINVGGILYGSPMVSWILNHRVQTMTYQLLFMWFRQRFQFVTSLERRAGGNLDFELAMPEHVKMINVLGFPLRKHLSSRRARRWHQRIGKLGPNESVTLLQDALRLPGHILPVWGVDHYLQDGWDASGLIRALLYYVATDTKLMSTADSPIVRSKR